MMMMMMLLNTIFEVIGLLSSFVHKCFCVIIYILEKPISLTP